MRIRAHFRIRSYVQDLARRVRRFSAAALVLVFLVGSVIVGKNIFLSELTKEIQKTVRFSSLRLSYLPPAVVLENVRSTSDMPLIRARRLRVELPFLSLLRNEKSVSVVLEGPEIHLRPEAPKPQTKKPRTGLSLPFTVEKAIVRDGIVTYEGAGGVLEVRGLKAVFTQKLNEFTLKATSEKSSYTILPEKLVFGGSLNISITGKGEEIKIQRLTVEGPDIVFKGEGRLKNLQAPEFELDTRFELDMAYAAAILDLPFAWRGKAGGQGKLSRKGGIVALDSDINADAIVLSGVPLGRVQGSLAIRFGTGGRIDLAIRNPNAQPESVSVSFGNNRVEGQVSGVPLDPVMSDIQVPWPVKSPAWGTFSVADGKLVANAEFREEFLERDGNRFPLRGKARVAFDLKTRHLEISAPDIQSTFGRVEGRSSSQLGGDIDAQIRGTVSDIKQAREFVSLILAKSFDFPEIRGTGYADVRLTGSSLDPNVAIKGTFTSAGFNLFNAASVDGEAVMAANRFDGTFHAEDPDLKGDIHVSVDPVKTAVEVQNVEGDLGKIFAGLRIPVPVQGRAAGDFRFVETPTSQDVSGTFSSPEITGFGQKFSNVKGRLDWKDGTISFPEIGLDMYGGRVQGRALYGLSGGTFDTDIRADNINLALLVPKVSGVLSLTLAGRGVFGTDQLAGQFNVQDLILPPVQKVAASGKIRLDYLHNQLTLSGISVFAPGDNEAQALIKIPLSGDALSGTVNGHWTNLDLLLPWTGAKGRLDFSAEISGSRQSPSLFGTIVVQGPLMPLPRFAHALTDYSATAQVLGPRIVITDLKAKLGGGDVTGSGEIGLGTSGVETIDVTAAGKDMQLAPLERTRAVLDGDIRLIKDSRLFVLDGNLLVKKLVWRREIYEKFAFFSPSPYASAREREPDFFDNLSLNLRLRAPDNAQLDNSLGKISGRFDLTVTGNINDPVLIGDIEALKGSVNFQDTTFRILRGRLSFVNPASTEPYLDVKGEAYVKDYRVTMSLTGPASRLRPEFTSSPPMPPEDVLALLAQGEAFKSAYTYSPERNTTFSTASLLSFQIADQAKKRAESLFTLDRFRVDPFVTGSSAEMTARLTLGKKLSRNVIFIYSTNLATQREEIYRMEWELGSDFSLVGVRNEFGRISFDLKFRKRF